MNQRKNTPMASLANQKSIRNSPRLQPPGLVQQKAAISPVRTHPTAPPVYRPQPLPKVLQRKAALPTPPSPVQTQRTPIAPPVYRPQPLPRVLQRQVAGNQRAQINQLHPQPVVAPPANHRPTPGKIVQPKAAMAAEARKSSNEMLQRHRNSAPKVLQMKQATSSVSNSRIVTNSNRPNFSILRQSVIQRSAPAYYTAKDIANIILNYRKAKNIELLTTLDWPEIKKIPGPGTSMLDEIMKANDPKITLKDVKIEFKKISEIKSEIEDRQGQEQRGREREQKRVSEDRTYRRKEYIVRLLETPDNVCVAMTFLDGKLFAAANKGALAKIAFDNGELIIDKGVALEKVEGELDVKASKLSNYLSQDSKTASYLSQIVPVDQTHGGTKHAEMKLLDFLYWNGKKGTIVVYISRLCCAKCRVAIDIWNEAQTGLRLDVREGSHWSSFPGWDAPDCFNKEGLLEKLLAKTGTKSLKDLSSKESVNSLHSQRRDRSESPPPKGTWQQ
jgi:hypothetical protein